MSENNPPQNDELDLEDAALLQKLETEGIGDRFVGPAAVEAVDLSGLLAGESAEPAGEGRFGVLSSLKSRGRFGPSGLVCACPPDKRRPVGVNADMSATRCPVL